MVPGLRAGDDASLLLGGVVAGADHPPRLPGAGPYRFDALSGSTSPRGWLLRVRTTVASSQEGSCVLAPEPSWRNDIAVVVSPPLGAAATLDEELASISYRCRSGF